MSLYTIDIETTSNISYEQYADEKVSKFLWNGGTLTKAFYKRLERDYAEYNKDIALNPKLNTIRLLQIAGEDGFIRVYDMFNTTQKLQAESFITEIMPYNDIIVHNAKFDLATILFKYNVYPKRVFDTMLATQLIFNFTQLPLKKDEKSNRVSASLQHSIEYFLGIKLNKEEQTSNWGGQLSDSQIEYAKNDVKHLIDLAKCQINILNKDCYKANTEYVLGLKDFITILEMQFVKSVIQIEALGVPINVEELTKYKALLETNYNNLNAEFTSLGVNPNSPQQVKKHFARLGIELESTDVDSIKALDNDFAKKVIDIKQTRKLITEIEKYLTPDNRVYTSYKQILRSGRMASTNENIQQINRNIKKIFYAITISEFDYSSAELFIASSVWKVTNLFNAFKNKRDAHKTTASLMLNIDYENITKELRQLGKAISFASLYGAGSRTVRDYLKINFGIDLTLEETDKRREDFFRAYPEIREYHKKIGNSLQLAPNGVVISTVLGRRALSNSYTVSINSSIQGAGADALKIAVLLYHKKYNNIVNLVHDSIILENATDAQKQFCKDCMVKAMLYIVPELKIEVE